MEFKHLSKIAEKGDPIAIIGISASGKSTLIVMTALNREVRRILRKRLAHGKGTLSDTRIIITDYSEIPDNAIILKGKYKKYTGLSLNQENKLVGWILYMAIKDYCKNNKECDDFKRFEFTENVLKYFKEKIDSSDNDATEFKLRGVGDYSLKELVYPLQSINVDILGTLYEECMNDAVKSKSTDTKIKSFTTLLVRRASSSEHLNNAIMEFWNNIAEHINYTIDKLKQDVMLYNDSKGYTTNSNQEDELEMLIEEKDLDNPIVEGLLNGEKKGQEEYISDLSIIFKNEEIFKRDTNGKFAVMEIGGNLIHNICLIDTKGLFHSQDVTADEERGRIVDIAEKYHCDKIIFTSNSNVDVMVKNGMSSITQFYRHSKKKIKTYFIQTHYDELLLNVKRHLIEEELPLIDFDKEALEIAEADLQFEIDAALESNSSKYKPPRPIYLVCGMKCGDSGAPNSIDDVIGNEYTYDGCINYILDDIINDPNRNVYKIKNSSDLKCVMTYLPKPFDFSSIILNILDCRNDCEDISPIHPSWKTVEAIMNHWKNEGLEFESKARGLDSGYSKTSSYFVREIREFVDNSISENVAIMTDELDLVDDNSKQMLHDNLKQYFRHELGTEFVKQLFFKLESMTGQNHICHYVYLRELLYNLQTNYFQYKNMPIMEQFYFILYTAIETCKIDFINEKCLEVY